ncbi:IDEAL domain-containing protein [Priestia aryabhattai]|uniref:IDEAL domain-containing protein n=1 Tax=Priestia aryabhattai TaxID=412384 RepID=UPI0015F6D2D2|nr:IDEAL domain-containing protein [Priestia aryabhattai]
MSEWSDFYREMEDESKMKKVVDIESILDEYTKSLNEIFKDFDAFAARSKDRVKSEDVKDDDVKLKDSEQLALINRYIDMALDTNDREWFMELAIQKNKLISKKVEE